MCKFRYSDEQIAATPRQAEIGKPVADITRKLGISESTFYVWKRRFRILGTPEIRELRQLRDETAVVADLPLDRAVLQDVLNKSCEPNSPARRTDAGARYVAAQRAPRLQGPFGQPSSGSFPIGPQRCQRRPTAARKSNR